MDTFASVVILLLMVCFLLLIISIIFFPKTAASISVDVPVDIPVEPVTPGKDNSELINALYELAYLQRLGLTTVGSNDYVYNASGISRDGRCFSSNSRDCRSPTNFFNNYRNSHFMDYDLAEFSPY